MCNAISPEKAVMWTLLFEGGADPSLSADHFTFEIYRRWFCVLAGQGNGTPLSEGAFSAQVAQSGHVMDRRELRALRRMLRVPPPPRVRANRDLLVQALTDRHAGLRMHIERLIN